MIGVGKTITINNIDYKIEEEFIETETLSEVMVLKRPINLSNNTIYDLGYTSTSDILYSDEEKLIASKMLDNKIGKQLDMAMVDPTGLITIKEFTYLGSKILDDIAIIRLDGDIHQISIEKLIDFLLLADEYKVNANRYKIMTGDKYSDVFEDDDDFLEGF
jgi:hypothetical protein